MANKKQQIIDVTPNNEVTKIPEQSVTIVKEICNKFKYEIMRCVNCPILMECKHTQGRLDKLRRQAEKIAEDIYQEEIELDDSADNALRAQNKRDMIYKEFIYSRAFDVLKNERCVFERQEILDILEKFTNAHYDLSDPRAYLIINELLGNVLNSGRANKAFTSLGIILKKETPAGPVFYQNPLLKTKMEFSKLIIEATEALDRILKSDDSQRAGNDFTTHLLQALQIREESEKSKQKEIGLDDI